MEITANKPDRKSWIDIKENSDFPIQNIPFGVFTNNEDSTTVGVRIGDKAIDLASLQHLGYLKDIKSLEDDVFLYGTLNEFISLGSKTWRQARNRIADVFDKENTELQENKDHIEQIVYDIDDIIMQLPVYIGDYTDFYSSKEHATNVGTMFRDPENALLPNWLHIPVGYHGRASSVVLSDTDIRRPKGQTLPLGEKQPVFGQSNRIDFELEMAFITTDANEMGDTVAVDDAEDKIFGMVLFNDWSARDMQAWEYVPLGPFLAKNFASTISPWIVTLDALKPYKTVNTKQSPEPLPYLLQKGENNYDIKLQAAILPEESGIETIVTNTNFKHMYWTMAQQLALHTVNGCNVMSGDLMGSVTISGPTPDSYGSMLELAWKGTKPVKLNDGTERKFINDNDTVILRGHCYNGTTRIGFGECRGKILPAKK